MPGESSTLQPLYREGRLVGTRIIHRARVYELPQYPHRIRALENRPEGLVVHFRPTGHSRLLQETDGRPA